MMRHLPLLAAVVLALPAIAAEQPKPPRVSSDGNGILIERNGATTRLTTSRQDKDPALSPDGRVVVFTRKARVGHDEGFCANPPQADELRQIDIDGRNDRLLLTGRAGEPDRQLCDFSNKQFSSDGRRLYFMSPGWATSGALHVYDLSARDEHFLLPANDVVVLNFCSKEYRDDLAVQSHRYFVFGGSYDWYWLYDAAGKKELGPLGEFASREDLIKTAHDDWCQ